MRQLSTTLSGLAFLWAAAATAYLLMVPVYQGVVTSSGAMGGEEVVGRLAVPLLSANGVWVAAVLLMVTLIAALPFGMALRSPGRHRAVAWGSALMLMGFSLVAGFSVGLMYVPCAVALLASAVAVQIQGRRVESPRSSTPPGDAG